MAEEWRLERREKEKQIPPVTVREPICALVLQKWIKLTDQHLFCPV